MIDDAMAILDKREDVICLRLLPLLPRRIKRGIVSRGVVVWRVADGGIQLAFLRTKRPAFPRG
jgi:hypothetical protein